MNVERANETKWLKIVNGVSQDNAKLRELLTECLEEADFQTPQAVRLRTQIQEALKK
jgi:hypothetical protein